MAADDYGHAGDALTITERRPAADTTRSGVRGRHLALAAVGLLVASYLSLTVAVVPIPLRDLFSPSPEQWQLLTLSRIPRVLSILLAGAALSVAGLIMQRITQNSFVSPSTSGTTEAAILGVLIATMFTPGESLLIKMTLAIAVSLAGTFGFLAILRRMPHREPIVVALVGLMYGGIIGAVTVFIAYQLDLLQLLEIWSSGSFSAAMAGQYEPLFLVLLVGAVGYAYADRFTVVGMGREFATNLGVSYQSVLNIGIVVVSVMAAVVIVVVGTIPFLGLIVPNVVSLLMGDQVRRALPVTALAGAGFVLVCDVLGRIVRFPYEVPVGTVAGVIGAGVFIWLVLRSAAGKEAHG